MLSVPVVVVTCDRFKDKIEHFRYQYAIQSIISIKNHFQYPNKIIVVDNNSSNQMVNMLNLFKESGIIHKLILNDKNTGIAHPKNQGIQAIDFDYKYWHTINDTPDKCSAASLGKVGRVVTAVIYEE